ncbi:MAG: hypothetical protein CO103_02605 [Chloroflexi bacterium CG_4_9_14_3_um_filter_45_9]|nr:MAG: hypothetical protein CO103_02605 [Chloroflexi bacterium CG_4_9_14_3_um_filter_45_9]
MKTINLQPISENAKVISGFAFKSTEFIDIGIPVVKITNVKKVSVTLEDCQFVDRKYLSLNEKYKINNGDVLIALTGSHLSQPNSVVGRVARYHYKEIALLNQRVGKFIIHGKNNLDLIFLYYYLVQDKILYSLALNAKGSANQANISPSDVERILIPVFTLSSQRVIADILSTYDDLIDTNRRRIQLLEEAARLLFREWFVYFRFPCLRQGYGGQAGYEKVHPVRKFDSNGVKIVDGVPEGWRKEKLNRIVSFLGGHAFKSTSYKQAGKYGIVTIKNVQQSSFIPKCTDYLDDTPDAMKKHCFLTNGDILISLTGNVGRVCLVYGENYLLNQRVAKIEAKKLIPKSFIYWMFDNSIMQKRIENLSFGSAQQNLSPIKLGEQTVIIPPDPLLKSFDGIVSLINIEIVQLLIQNQKLAQARDLLLPRLMSGEIDLLRYDKLSNGVGV